MRNYIWLIAAAIGLLLPVCAFAVTQTMQAVIRFDTPMAQTKLNDVDFGSVMAGQAGTYMISTDGRISPGGGGMVIVGTPTAGKIRITGSSTQSLTISTGAYAADRGVTPSSATCKFGAGRAAACDAGINVPPPGHETLLYVGLRVTADGTQNADITAAPSFVVSVVYN